MNCFKDFKTFFQGWTIGNCWFAFCLTLIFFGMLYSPFVASLARGLIILDLFAYLIFWKKRVSNFKKKIVPLLCLSILYLLDIVGCLWSNDMRGAKDILLHDYNFLIIPLFIALYSPIKKNVLTFIIIVYLFLCWLGVVVGSFNYITNNYTDIRHIVTGTRHIAFAINIAFATCLLMVYTYRVGKYKKIIIPIIIWQLAFLTIAQMISGLVACVVFVVVSVVYLFFTHRNKVNTCLFVSLVLFFVLSLGGLVKEYNNYFTPKENFMGNRPIKTKEGNFYKGQDDGFIENGYLVNNYVCDKEVEKQWQEQTGVSLYTPTRDSSYLCSDVVYRYLNSKGLHKDAEGVKQLSQKDIDNIKNGIANVVYTEKYSLRPRLYQTFFEFERFKNEQKVNDKVNGKSLIQRIVMTQAAFKVINKTPLIGTGTGAESTYLQEQILLNYPILNEKKIDPHNQFVYIMLNFGIVGLVCFILASCYPVIKLKLWQNDYFICFALVLVCYMLTESCLRMMAGEIFFSVFFSALIFNNDSVKHFLNR